MSFEFEQTPSKISFVPSLSEKILGPETTDESNQIAEMIYNVLFSRKLSELNKQEISFLSTLLNSENYADSVEILKTIAEDYPATKQTLRVIRKHRKLFPMPILDEQAIQYLHSIEASIFDLFDKTTSNEEILKLLNKILWPAFLSKVKKEIGDKAYRNVKTNFKISNYDLKSKKIDIITNSEKQYLRFERNVTEILKKTIDLAELPQLKLKYNINTKLNNNNNNRNNNNNDLDTVYKKPIQAATFPLDKNMQRDNCYVPNKEEIYKAITDKTNTNKNFYIQAESLNGKTHLVQAICKKLKKVFPKEKIVYIKGSVFYDKYQRSAAEDRDFEKKTRKVSYKSVNNFNNSFNNAKVIIIDDIEQLQGQKTSTQNLFKQITERTGAQIILTSYLNMSDIIINKKIILKEEGRSDYIRSSIPELYNPILLKASSLDTEARIQIAEKMLSTELFTPPASQGIIKFLAESNIPLTSFKAVFDSITFNSNGNILENDPNDAFHIIQQMTGTVLKPNTNEILQIMLDAFNDDQIKQYLNINEMGGFPKSEHINAIKQVRGSGLNTTDGVLLRATIFFIKKHYPNESFEDISTIFNRTNANILHKEIADYLKDNKKLETYLDSQIAYFLKKKYGLLEENDPRVSSN